MKIVTSYHHKTDRLLEAGFAVFNISRFPPRWIAKGKQIPFPELAPTVEMVRNGYEWEEFDFLLEKLNPEKVYKELIALAELNGKQAIALCCYEKDQDKCHRRRIKFWLSSHGYEVNEYADPSGK